ncbi:MAG: ABC transporter ATP-binding protein [Planctomycetales bacterium]|nr:ABC transporter ATP-binding protein [Planctomycetales bacterium]
MATTASDSADDDTGDRDRAAQGRRMVWDLIRGQRLRYAAAITAMAVGTTFLLSVPYLLKRATDAIARGDADLMHTVVWAAVGVVAFTAADGFFTYLRGRWAAQASEGAVRGLRHQLYSHLERLPCRYHDQADTGDLVQRCSSDVETVRVFLAAQVVEIARVSLLLAVAVPIMLSQDWRMSLLALCLVPVIVAMALLFFRKVRRLFEQVDESEGRLTTVLQENLTGIRVVRAFAQQDHEINKFLERNGEFRDLEYRLFIAMSNYWTTSDLLVFTQIGIVLVGGGFFVVQGQISPGTWVLFWWLLRTIIWPVRHIGRVLADSGKATVAIDRIGEVLAEPPESVEAVPAEPIGGAITIENLTFSYGNDRPALDGLSLNIAEGETVALLGPPGAGKSTLINLLVRLYDYEQGSIHVGPHELRTINRDALRDAFGVVLQDPFLYSKTVRENIVIGHTAASDAEVESSAHAADIHGNISGFADGYDTVVGERGVTLSGGQRQRLAIARALVKDPAFLVLDDSLSAVDTKTEARILRALARRHGNRTTILIAHRLSSTRLADRIFLLDQGRLVQAGTHDELMAVEGPYRRLWNLQGSLEDDLRHDLAEATSATPRRAVSEAQRT